MDNELYRMQRQADRICNVKLRRIEQPDKSVRQKPDDDSLLLLGLILILAAEKADPTLLMMLLYIFA